MPLVPQSYVSNSTQEDSIFLGVMGVLLPQLSLLASDMLIL